MILIEKGIRSGICQATHRYAKANNKYMKNYNKNIESSYIEYLDANNLYGWVMSQKSPVNNFRWVKKEESSNFNETFIKNYDENGNIGYFCEVDIDYPKELFNNHKDLPFSPESKKVNKVEKLICSIENKEKYVIHIRSLKQALNHGLKLKKMHRVIQFKQKAWLKVYINMNTELRKNEKNEFEKNFFKLMNNYVFGKTMENVRNHRYMKLVTSDKRRKRLVSEPNYHSHKKFSDHLMAKEMKKTRVKMTKPLYLGMSVLDISKVLMYEFWYDYISPKYGGKAKLCYTDADSFIIYIKTEDFFEDIFNDNEKWFDTSNYDKNDKRPLPIGKNKKVPGLFNNELGGKIIIEVVVIRRKTYGYIADDGIEHKKAKGTKKCIIKREIIFENSAGCLLKNKNIYRSQERFKSYNHDVYTEEVNKIALSTNDDKSLQAYDKIKTYPNGTNAFKVCESEMLNCKRFTL